MVCLKWNSRVADCRPGDGRQARTPANQSRAQAGMEPQCEGLGCAFRKRDPILNVQAMNRRINSDLERMLDRVGKRGCGAEQGKKPK